MKNEIAQRQNLWQRLAPVIGLFFLSPLVGEYLLGNISIQDIWALPFLAPMYGGGALLTYAWGGFILTALLGRTESVHLIGNVIFATGAIMLLIIAARKTRKSYI